MPQQQGMHNAPGSPAMYPPAGMQPHPGGPPHGGAQPPMHPNAAPYRAGSYPGLPPQPATPHFGPPPAASPGYAPSPRLPSPTPPPMRPPSAPPGARAPSYPPEHGPVGFPNAGTPRAPGGRHALAQAHTDANAAPVTARSSTPPRSDVPQRRPSAPP